MIPPDLQVSDRWKLRTKTLYVGRIPLLMGIINVTPDSFSDGGKYFDPDKAIEHGLRLSGEGADILDIGGQSTRPGAQPISAQEELRRVMPVVSELCRLAAVPISIDTFEPSVAQEALVAGVEAINDITAFTNPQMLKLAVSSACGLCAMHLQGTPQTMQDNPEYEDVVVEVLQFLRQRRDALLAAGVDAARIALDPGIGFGKTAEHNIALLSNAWRFHALNCPVLIGHSRKRFIGQFTAKKEADPNVGAAIEQKVGTSIEKNVGARIEQKVGATVELSPQQSQQSPLSPQQSQLSRQRCEADPLPGTIGVALALARQGVQILRVHDVQAIRHALVLFDACAGR